MGRGGARPGSGRPKGSIRTAHLLKAMQEADYDPIKELMNEAQDPNTEPDIKRDIAKFFVTYSVPKLASIEMETNAVALRPEGVDDLFDDDGQNTND